MDPSILAEQNEALQVSPLMVRMRELARERTEPIRRRAQDIAKALDEMDEFLRESAVDIPEELQFDVADVVVRIIQGAEIQRQQAHRDAMAIVSTIIVEVLRDTPVNATFRS